MEEGLSVGINVRKKEWFEKLYILYRRFKAVLSWMVYCVCGVFTIQGNKIVFSSFEGGGYGCNPKYIAEEIIRRMKKNGKTYKMVWLVNDTSKVFPPEIKAVKNNLWNRAFHLSTAKIWVDNSRKNYGTRKRKGQFYLQTWHGPIGMKPIGRLRGTAFSKIAELVTRYDGELIDCFLINSERARRVFTAAFYGEPFMNLGSPRCDILVNNRERQYVKIRELLNLPKEAKLCMYAPTFRGGNQHTQRWIYQEQQSLDCEKLQQSLHERFGGTWWVLLRLHPQLAVRNMTMQSGISVERCIDISLADDMYEYLAAIDAFVSDYSSAEFEAAYMGVPVFMYADDLDDYVNGRGKLLDKLEDIPFSIATTNEELSTNILRFKNAQYEEKVHKFFEKAVLFEDGKASKRVVNLLLEQIKTNVGETT